MFASHPASKILVVDDNLDNVNVLSTLLRERGYIVRKVLDGKMALMEAYSSPPDLILLDINMSEMNGYEVCEKLKADEKTKQIPVIFLSALDHTLDKVRAFQVGGVDYITKPLQFEEVVVRVETHLSVQNLQKKLQEQNSLLQEQNLKLQVLEANEREKSQQLEQALNRLKVTQFQLIYSTYNAEQFLVRFFHKIARPLTTIHQAISLVCSEDFGVLEILPANLKSFFISIQNSAEISWNVLSSLNHITFSLQLFSRLNESALKVVDIHAEIDNTLIRFQYRLQKNRRRAEICMVKQYGKLPSIECEAWQIKQVVFHLLNNAIESFEREESNQLSSPTITITTEQLEANRIAISIQDNGCGIHESIQSQIFDPFFTTKKIGAGQGLGLTLCYQIVATHQGEIKFDSILGESTTFTVCLPIHKH